MPYLNRGPMPWVQFWDKMLGDDFYIVHFNKQPNVAARVFEANTERVLRNMYRTDQWLDAAAPERPGMPLIHSATHDGAPGKLCMSEEELAVFVEGFKTSGFEHPICWYRNFDRNWELLGKVPAAIHEKVSIPVLMIHATYDIVPQNPKLNEVVADLEVAELDCGHWIMQERPEQTTRLMLDWISRKAS